MTNPADADHNPHHRNATLAVPHHEPLNPRGITITCAMCNAARDWLLIHVQPDLIFVRCRCAHEWHEHDLDAADVTATRGDSGEEQEWASFEEMYRSLGFDGLFRYTNLRRYNARPCSRRFPDGT
ncbi:hypothetical protein [Kitasatospora purpeofusca]|uniref:hypothetical protein n=1 Tax=Kitasatospora purpeofusca TaxID=67352 RepID=UPI00225516CA|nr:hypothetical protein [Kitasatospora purpeofusca]MCX4753469.1 hypothetical protein [Kitasatospora purpeofusca]WSR32965.1 hypothetical protein OG715_19430 [Kitasatospora purpeofusca]